MTPSKRSLLSLVVVVAAAARAGSVNAQFGARGRGSGGATSNRSSHTGDDNRQSDVESSRDPLAPILRELPLLRTDLKLTSEQASLFDGFERQLRDAAEAERLRAGHISAFRFDDGSSIPAKTVLGTIADDDSERANSARLALDQMVALYAVLMADQRAQFDQRIIQAVRHSLVDHP